MYNDRVLDAIMKEWIGRRRYTNFQISMEAVPSISKVRRRPIAICFLANYKNISQLCLCLEYIPENLIGKGWKMSIFGKRSKTYSFQDI